MSFEPDLLYTEVEEDLRASVRNLLARRCDAAALIAVYDGDAGPISAVWRELATDLGLAGLIVPEERGGAGATAAVAGVVLEEIGRAAAPVPFLTSAVVAVTVLQGTDADGLLERTASGESTAALTVPFSTSPYAEVPKVVVADGRPTGTVRSVAGAESADVLLVPGDDGALYAVEATDATIEVVPSLDMTRVVADVTLSGATGERISDDADAAVRPGLVAGAALLASEQAGVARWCLDATVAYLQQRRQFGRVVGGFQAIKHRLADLYVAVESGCATARYAAVSLAELGPDDPETAIATAVAASYCGDLAVLAGEEAVQLHGGIGMTWEHPAHVYLKRAKADQIGLGTPGAHRAALADLVDLPATG
ncbi:acyl-CoA/acyl-ACP dehydrogenase [Tsukamurella sp. 8F]|uniref:acyl-CoA dehydrogenase family protein n=1 Tax=unclassified Tsukamurella TaxID=2633480 RepID=UPI0023BA2FA8|nr:MULTISPECIES: acyl-CoA dehydrogenase family protein [unclassified Tsukamurella]MDF0531284.1 acyl-CoA/acyl-ACP dehydrogenase [Tsukamurella sp. 8J]MDF0585233.1 acyl-CoA/acyl-ACP dehydrogenase [Tsukamurella sp. 8F]